MKSLLFIAIVCTLWSTGSCLYYSPHYQILAGGGSNSRSRSDSEERRFNFERDLEPWSSLKRSAGYYTFFRSLQRRFVQKARDEGARISRVHC